MSGRGTDGSNRGRWLLGYAAMLGLLLAIVGLKLVTGAPMGDLTRDVFSTMEAPVWTGFLSNVSVFLWIAAASIALFALGTRKPEPASRRWDGLLAGLAVLSLMWAADDFFMIHEWIVPRFLGIHEWVVYGAHGTILMACVVVFRDQIRAAGAGALWAALALLGLSLGFDAFESEPTPEWHYLIEEGLKLLGIGTWLGFVATVAAKAVRAEPASTERASADRSSVGSGSR